MTEPRRDVTGLNGGTAPLAERLLFRNRPLIIALYIFLLLRLGLVAMVAGLFTQIVLDTFPITLDVSGWYFGASLWALAAIAALGIYGLHASLAGRSLFKDDLLRV